MEFPYIFTIKAARDDMMMDHEMAEEECVMAGKSVYIINNYLMRFL